MRLRVIHRATALGSVTGACQEAGTSRTVFYRWRKRFEQHGADGRHPCRIQAVRRRPSEVRSHLERLVVELSLVWPTWGCGRLATHLMQQGLATLSPSTVQRCLRHVGLRTRRERLTVLEAHTATTGLLAERTRRALCRATGGRQHVAAAHPGELACVDTFYLGKLKGVGKVWQVTACDTACSYGAAQILPALSAQACAAFLRDVLVPLYRQAGWPLQRLFTDGGVEFKGAFAQACRTLGIRHTRTQPRHVWTNDFVKRFQGTLLQGHWRIQFRRRYFTSRSQLQQSLGAFVHVYNTQRPHSGYRVRGAPPRRSSGAPCRRRVEIIVHSRERSIVSTSLRVWTA